jgi:hypothetical protein
LIALPNVMTIARAPPTAAARISGFRRGNFESRNALSARANAEERSMLSTILIIVLILLLIGALPTWPYSANWGYGPGGGVGLLLIILVVLVLMGRI